MGSRGESEEKPVHKVTVPSFEIMKTEITVEMYRACVEAGKCGEPGTSESCNWHKSNRENHPINCVSWYNVNNFAKWVDARLPTEAEWEYAARGGGRNVKYPWGNTEPDYGSRCSYADIRGCNEEDLYGEDNTTSPVCNTPKGNSLDGLCDMAGNVSEIVQDEYHYNYKGAPNDGSAWCSVSDCMININDNPNTTHVVRGSCYYTNSSEQVTYRGRQILPDDSNGILTGGRLARSTIP